MAHVQGMHVKDILAVPELSVEEIEAIQMLLLESENLVPLPEPPPAAPMPIDLNNPLCQRCNVVPAISAIDEYCEACQLAVQKEIEQRALQNSGWR
jgi:hypothetical protein